MKICYIKLENFIGIYNGTGKFEFEVDFRNIESRNNIILLLGSNGSGKTSFLSCLHPFSGTMDDRNEIILSGKDGYKEIHFENNDNYYIIKHFYFNKRKRTSIKSYFSKNGTELNDNGTVKSFEELVKNELDVIPSFFILSRIGSNVKNFIGLKPAERKKYMSTFLPDVSAYYDSYKIVSEKYTQMNKKIKMITAEIDKIEDKESLINRIKLLSSNIKHIERNMETFMAVVNKNKGILSTMDVDKIEDEYETSKNKITTSKKNLIKLKDYFNDLTDKYELKESSLEKIDKEIEDINKKISSYLVKITELKNNISHKELENENLYNKIEKNKNELNVFNINKNIDELKELKQELENTIKRIKIDMKKYDKKYKINTDDEFILLTKNFFKSIQEDEIFKISIEKTTKYEKQPYFDLKDDSKCLATIKKYEEELNKLQSIDKKYYNKITVLQTKIELKEILNERPSKCKIDSCPFIAEALQYKDVETEIDELIKERNKNKENIDLIKSKLDDARDYYNNFFRNFNYLFKEIKKSHYYDILNRLIENSFDTESNFYDFITKDKNFILDIFQKALEYSHLFMDLEKNNKLYNETINNLDILESKNLLIDKLNKEIKSYSNSIIKNEKEISEFKNDYEKAKNFYNKNKASLNDLNETKNTLNLYIKTSKVFKKYKKIIECIKDDKDKIDTLLKENEINLKEYHDNKEINDDYIKQLDDAKYKLKRLEEFEKDLEESKKNFKNIELVKNALSPTKGIPLLFVQVYLEQTKNIANKLLNVAYEGKFYIQDFELTDNDFFIKIKKENAELIKDVTLTSQGEMSLIGLAISFAMIQQAKKLYNIILIDEMDKELDELNRRYFVQILEEQLNIMKVEQCFIISHNKEFDTSDLDMILFNGHGVELDNKDFMYNKNIFNVNI